MADTSSLTYDELARARGQARQCQRGAPFIDMTGWRIGRLVVTSRPPNKGRQLTWHCACDCGGKTTVIGFNLRKSVPTRSCGCLARDYHNCRQKG